MSVQEDYLRGIADAIREKEKSVAPIPATEFAERVMGLPTAPSGDISCLRHVYTMEASCNPEGIMSYYTASNDTMPRAMIIISKDHIAAMDEVPLVAYRDNNNLWYAQSRSSSSANSPLLYGLITARATAGEVHIDWAIYPDGLGASRDWIVMLFYDE